MDPKEKLDPERLLGFRLVVADGTDPSGDTAKLGSKIGKATLDAKLGSKIGKTVVE